MVIAHGVLRLFGGAPARRGFPRPRDLGEPEDAFLLLYSLTVGWLLLAPISSAVWLAIWAVCRVLSIQFSGVPVFEFLFAFCVAGGMDALCRVWFVWAARKRWRRGGRVVDRRVSRLMAYAAVDDKTLLLQLAVAVLVAFNPWTNV